MRINGVRGNTLDARDRGLHYGDGLFETIAVADAQPLQWSLHWQRLQAGCERLNLPPPDPDDLLRQIALEIDARPTGVIKLLLTRGSGGRGYRPPQAATTNLLISWHAAPDYPLEWRTQGIELRVCKTRLACNPALAGIKHLNRLEQVLARSEWQDNRIAEGLMLDPQGRVIEATAANLFVFDQGRLYTPPVDQCGVAGTMRAQLMRQAVELGVPCSQRHFDLQQLLQVQALLLTNAIIGCWPVQRLQTREYDFAKHLPVDLLAWMRHQGLGVTNP